MELNWQHPLAPHLIYLSYAKFGPSLHNICGKKHVPTRQGTGTPVFNGDAITLNSDISYTTNTKSPELTGSSNYFWWVKYKLNVAVANSRTVFGNRFGGGSTPLRFCKLTEAGFEYYNNGNDLSLSHPNTTGEIYDIMVVKRGNDFTLYLDGAKHATSSSSRTMNVENPVCIGGGADVYLGEPTNIDVYHAAHGPIAPTAEQVYSLYIDPEQLLDQYQDEYYYIPAGGGGGTTHEGAATLDFGPDVAAVSEVTLETSGTLPATLGITGVANFTTDQSAALAITTGFTGLGNITTDQSGSLDFSSDITGTSEITIEATGSLEASLSLASSVIATLEPSATLEATMGFLGDSIANMSAGETFTTTPGITSTGGLVQDVTGSMDVTVSLSATGEVTVITEIKGRHNFIAQSKPKRFIAHIKPKIFIVH